MQVYICQCNFYRWGRSLMLWNFWGGCSPGVRPGCPAVPLPIWGRQRHPWAPHRRRTIPRILCNLAGCRLSSSCSCLSSWRSRSIWTSTPARTHCPESAAPCPDCSKSPRSFASSPVQFFSINLEDRVIYKLVLTGLLPNRYTSPHVSNHVPNDSCPSWNTWVLDH